MKKYKYYQPNEKDLKDSYGDCTIRALTKTTGKTWLQIFDELTDIAGKAVTQKKIALE